MNPENTK